MGTITVNNRDWLSGLEMRLLTIRRTRKSMRGRVGTSPWPTSLLSLSHPPRVSSWHRKPMMHMATSQFMWELISSLPVSGKLWKGLWGTRVILALQQHPSSPCSSWSLAVKEFWLEQISSQLFSLHLKTVSCFSLLRGESDTLGDIWHFWAYYRHQNSRKYMKKKKTWQKRQKLVGNILGHNQMWNHKLVKLRRK